VTEITITMKDLVCFILCFSVAASMKQYDNYKVFRITPETERQVEILSTIAEGISAQIEEKDGSKFEETSISFWRHIAVNHSSDALVHPNISNAFSEFLQSKNIEHKIVNNNIQKAIDEESVAGLMQYGMKGIVGKFVGYDQIMTFLDEIEQSHKDIAEVYTYGKSYENRDLKAIKLSSGKAKYSILIDAGIHAREWIAQATAVWLINKMATGYGKDKTVTEILDSFDLHIVPVVNPDGYEYSRSHDRLWRKTRTNHGKKCMGADPNRNFDYPKFGGKGTSANSCSEIYRGPSAYSEKCADALKNFILSNKDNAILYLTLHSYGQYILIPYGYDAVRPSDHLEMDTLAVLAGNVMRKVNNHFFTVGNTAETLYPAAGGSDDYAKGTAGIKYSYTVELFPNSDSWEGFVTKPKNIIPTGKEVFAGLNAMAKEILSRHDK